MDFIQLWLRERQPDIVGLQELKLQDEQFPHDAFEAEGYHVLTHGQKSWNGVAILSKQKAELLDRGLPGQEAAGARLITARIGELSFSSLYCPNGKNLEHADYAMKLAWFDALAKYIASHKSEHQAWILGGDFNICPTALDSWNEAALTGQIFHTDAERHRMETLVDHGFADLYRQLHPQEQAFSWWDFRGGAFHKNEGLRIDFLLATAAIREQLKSVSIDRDYRKKKSGLTASDHAPVIAELG